MKITTRIAVGLTLLTGLTMGVLAYQLRTVNQLQQITDELAQTNVEAARISIRLVQALEGVGEFASKTLLWHELPALLQVGDDEGHEENWAEWEAAVDEHLRRLRALELGPRERQALRDVEAGWSRYQIELAPLRTDETRRPQGDELVGVLGRIEELMGRLRTSLEEVIEANHVEVARQARDSREAAARAATVSVSAAAGAVALGFLICLVLFLSISGPMKRLTRGTREVAEGRFHHRIPVSGRSELAALARDFNRMAARLDELEDMKRDFVSHVSHELKGPLAAIHETILVLLDEIPGPMNEKQRQLLVLSRQSATRLSGMIANLLQISRIESGALVLEPSWVHLEVLVGEVRDELSPLAQDAGVGIELADPHRRTLVAADADRLREVVANLVENAIKFSPAGERITVMLEEGSLLPESMPGRHRSEMVREKPPFVSLTVEDRGPGIPEEHREGVFEKFHQIKRGVRLQGQGVGLGLSICRNVVEAHGGVIWVEEGTEGGARFVVVVPQVPGALRGGVGPAPQEASTEGPAHVDREADQVGRPAGTTSP